MVRTASRNRASQGPIDLPVGSFGGSLGMDRPLLTTTKVLPEHARKHNRSLVLQLLYRNGGLSRADLARLTGLTKVTVSELVSVMLDEGIVVETRQRDAVGPGKRPVELDIARERWQIVAVDLSDADFFIGAVIDLNGTILERLSVKRAGARGEEALMLVDSLVIDLTSRATVPVLGVGVGSPGVIDLDGVVLSAPNLDWRDVPLRERLVERTGLPALVANDANVAILAEVSFGSVDHDLLLVKVGHGAGAAAIVNGRLVYGRGSAAGEIGHVVAGDAVGPPCACGRSGCLESWLAVPRLEARLAEPTNVLISEKVLHEAGQRLGVALAPIVGALGLTDVTVSGPSHLLDGPLLEATRGALCNRLLPDFFRDVQVRMTSQGEDIVLRGALILVLNAVLGIA